MEQLLVGTSYKTAEALPVYIDGNPYEPSAGAIIEYTNGPLNDSDPQHLFTLKSGELWVGFMHIQAADQQIRIHLSNWSGSLQRFEPVN
jgi:hypothetical protein